MRSKSKNYKKSLEKPELCNPNSEDQVKTLLKLLVRARQGKLDTLGMAWIDEDLGKNAYADYYDLPSKTLADMLDQLSEVVENSE